MDNVEFAHEDADTGYHPTYCPYGCMVLLDETCRHGCRSMKRVEELVTKSHKIEYEGQG
jgi:hypothetical protein